MAEAASYPSLAGRTVLVTGGGSGIGASLVEHFCRQGARVTFLDVQAEAAQALVGKLAQLGRRRRASSAAICAMSRPCRRPWPRSRPKDGPVAVLVNNAANDDRHRIEDVSAAYWDERIATNLRHQFFAAQAVIPGMKRLGGGSIVNFGSMTWHASEGGYPAYATCKAAVEGLTRSLARDLGPDRIRVNTSSPAG